MRLRDEQIDAILTAADPAYPAVNPEHAPLWRRKVRIIYAAAMRDAAGVAREHDLSIMSMTAADVCARKIATALETLAKETEDGR